jgi:hypothetical protein
MLYTGKTNHGQKLYGRTMRHKLVELCSVGGLSFYLAMRFWLTKEFEDFDFQDFLDNKKWFDIKLLTDATRSDHDHSKPMANHIQKALPAIRVVSHITLYRLAC